MSLLLQRGEGLCMTRGERQVLVNLGEAGNGVNEVRMMGRGKPQRAAPQAEGGRGGGFSAALARRLAVRTNLLRAWRCPAPQRSSGVSSPDHGPEAGSLQQHLRLRRSLSV